jgi:sterol desaturase/sphingolipid hydroxylase (fatty acid hydroxylase superfamily)
VEALLPRLGINTSAFHDRLSRPPSRERHHANANVNFGEAMIVWDHLMASHEAAVRARREDAARV